MMASGILKNRYRLQDVIGRGGMGVVFRALDMLAGRPVAVKILGGQLGHHGTALRFQREAEALSSLDHPNIVAVFDVGVEDETSFIVMELLPGRSLRSLIPLSPLRATEVVIQVCAALEYAHARGIVHRDVKPENVMVLAGESTPTAPGGEAPAVKVMDFGLSMRLEEREKSAESDSLVGTAAYLSPEQALGMRADVRSDLYSLGAMFFELVTGREVFPGKNLLSVIHQHLDEPPTPPRRLNPELPPQLERVILRLLRKDPAERYQTAAEVKEALEQALSAHEPPPPDVPGVAMVGSEVRTPAFIGREKDLAFLRSKLRAASEGQGSLVLIGGEPGVGKTRLVQELLGHARLRRGQILSGACYEQEAGLPYQPFVDAIRLYLQTIGAQRPSLVRKASHGYERELGLLVPEIRQFAPDDYEIAATVAGEAEKGRLFEAVRRFLCGLTEEGSTVLFLDDLQWADAGTLQLLHYVARLLIGERVLIAGTYRDTEPGTLLSDLLRQLSREKLAEQVILERLSAREVGALASSLLGKGELADELVERIYAETEGNAFFVVETVQHLLEEETIALSAGRWRTASSSGSAIPLGVRDVVARRLGRLGPGAQQVLSVAAVVGREFGFDTLLKITDRTEDELLEAIEDALKARLIREKLLRREDRYDFAHGKIREVLYQSLSTRRRRILHRAIGESLETMDEAGRDQIMGELAYHFGQAGEAEKAMHYGLRAGDLALGVYATEDAARHYADVVALIADLGGHPNAVEAKTKLGESYMILGRFGEAQQAFAEALALLGEHGSDVQLALLHDDLAMASERLGHYDNALQHLFTGLDQLGTALDSLDAARIYGHLAVVSSRKGQYQQAEEYALRHLALAESLANDEEVASACTILARLSSLRARWDDASRYTARALEVWQRKNDVYRQASNYLNLGVNLWPLGRLSEAAKYWEMALRMSDEIHYATGQMQSHINLGNYFLRVGDLGRAAEHYRTALHLAENSGHTYYTARALLRLGEQHRLEGDLDGSLDLLGRAEEMLAAMGHTVALSEVLWHLAESQLGKSQLVAASRTAERALELGQRSESVEEVANARRVLAAIEAEAGRPEAARRLFLESLEAFARLGDVYELARAQLYYARFLLTQPDSSSATLRDLLTAAARTFADLATPREKREADHLLAGLGDPTRPA